MSKFEQGTYSTAIVAIELAKIHDAHPMSCISDAIELLKDCSDKIKDLPDIPTKAKIKSKQESDKRMRIEKEKLSALEGYVRRKQAVALEQMKKEAKQHFYSYTTIKDALEAIVHNSANGDYPIYRHRVKMDGKSCPKMIYSIHADPEKAAACILNPVALRYEITDEG
jgi:hypothetical protein